MHTFANQHQLERSTTRVTPVTGNATRKKRQKRDMTEAQQGDALDGTPPPAICHDCIECIVSW
jgi:hypothetical protein